MENNSFDINVQWKKEKGCLLKINATITMNSYKEIVNNALEVVRKKKTLPGFRKSKVPAERILESFSDEVISNAAEEVVSRSVHKACVELGVNIIRNGLKKVEWNTPVKVNMDKDLNVSLECEYYPTLNIDVEDLSKKCNIDRFDFDVSDSELKDVEHSLMKAHFSSSEEKGSGVEDEDYIIFDILDENENVVKSDISSVFSSSMLNFGIYNALKGKSAGSEVVEMLPLSAQGNPMYYRDVRGQNSSSSVTQYIIRLKSVQKVSVPEVDEKIATEGLGADSVEDFRNKLRVQVGKKKKIEGFAKIEEGLMRCWSESNDVDIPFSWVDEHVDRIADIKKAKGEEFSDDEQTQARKNALISIAYSIALKNYVNDKKIELEESDIMVFTNKMLLTGRMNYQQATEIMSSPEKAYKIRENILASKASDIIIDKYLELI